ncbi:hypothetical protein MLD38_007798 [Melastoma candidum]|uniref:Uncharacterized protein n=1 Tax=Melastoma candidum TaxID=119954 RepID=A0ACB9RWJ7_9MYRT|nr:hypothetical protein MLD38_007798 [Melastoma candidum]
MVTAEEIVCCEALPLLSLNHISLLCRSVRESARFYEHVLGFVLIKRPSSFDFNGAWLFNYGTGIHLIENPSLAQNEIEPEPRPINPKDNHISFLCSDVELVKRRLQAMGMRYVTAVVEEGGVKVDQVFFHDPDGYMIEICTCDKIPILPIASRIAGCSTCSLPLDKQLRRADNGGGIASGRGSCGRFLENVMMESLSLDMMNFSF